MGSSVKLHPKYGLNPCIGVCLWCGEDNGQIVMLGFNGGREAPRRAVIHHEPCDKCKAKMAQGITFIRTNDAEEVLGWCVIKEEVVREHITDPEMLAGILKARKAYVADGDWEIMGFPSGEKHD